MIGDWLGWDGLSIAEQLAVLFYGLVFGAIAGGSVLVAYALFGIGPKRTPAKKRKKARKQGRR